MAGLLENVVHLGGRSLEAEDQELEMPTQSGLSREKLTLNG